MNSQFYEWMLAGLLAVCSAGIARGQAPDGPMTPAPDVKIQPGPPKIKLRSILVNTPVTVRDAKGEMVHSLEASEFKIMDNGVEQKITHFDLGGEPLSLVVVVETSSRVEPMLAQIRKTGILFSKRGVGRRRVMLVMAEAHDSGSEDKLGEVLRRAQLANITIYAVGLSSTKADLLRKPNPNPKEPPHATPEGIYGIPPAPGTIQTPTTERQRAEQGSLLGDAVVLAIWAVMHAKDQVTKRQLEIAAAATGGMHVSTWKDKTMEKVIEEVGGELHAQYTLTYTPSDSDGAGYHEIQVTIARPELKVRARPGYYLAGPEE